MKEKLYKPDYLVEVSWEVCNLVGGIYTVLSTKAETLHEIFGDHLVFIGPDIYNEKENPFFIELPNVLGEWCKIAVSNGLKVRTGRWNIPGSPIVVLVDFDGYYERRNELFARMWEWYGVDSMPSYGDYDEASMFSIASAKVIESLNNYWRQNDPKAEVLAQFNEWTTGIGLLYIKKKLPEIATVFTTHATSIGRSIAGNNKPLYDYLNGYFGDQMAQELNMVSKHSVEKTASHQADCFTTVSDITAKEASQLLEREPLVTPNGFENNFVAKGADYTKKREKARSVLLRLAENLIGYIPTDAFLVGTAGRSEFKNKGIDVFLDSLSRLRAENSNKEIIAFVLVPGWSCAPRHDLKLQMEDTSGFGVHRLKDPIYTHTLNNYNEDAIIRRINELHFRNENEDKVKVIYVPSYLKGDDGIINMPYYDILIGLDLTIFPSYYEPWGYTPLESIAFGVPTITTDLSGFGMWCESEGVGENILSGVKVVHRTDSNYSEVVEEIANTVEEVLRFSPTEISKMHQRAKDLSSKAQWKSFINYYLKAFNEAIKNKKARLAK
ncbi:MAG: glycogen/starch synthase [Bacteroidales bacterium]|nr:glycogen/starch synthase [Bacteroidales bacterium]